MAVKANMFGIVESTYDLTSFSPFNEVWWWIKVLNLCWSSAIHLTMTN
jgi:uncharacterized membrane protein